jgi:cell wall-associated NlpC family hydrolase
LKKSLCILALVLGASFLPAVALADESIVQRALGYLGIRYLFGGQSETRGFDCAGFVKTTFAKAGIRLPRTAAQQFKEGCEVKRDELQPGDLVFFARTYKRGISHVGIYVGDGRFVHAASTGRKVRVDRLDSAYYASRFAGARRIPQPVLEPDPIATVETTADATQEAPAIANGAQ